ncbi:MAG TPA: right-handed parallel beta-helix repeat-containing protein [Planctomycetota bacterium]|jgi:hypothetical protein|nr:right-handed parallel beta-helix repeat-containing protein [Planctomycetota bacterium]
MCIVRLVLPLLLAATVGLARAQNTLRVPADFPTVQAAILAAIDGDTVLVAPGIYVENVDFLGRAIAVVSSAGPELTILDGASLPIPVVTFANGEPDTAVLSGFTVRYGAAGGILVDGRSSPTIVGNLVRDNADCLDGAGIEVHSASPRIVGNVLQDNFQPIFCWGASGGAIAVVGDCAGTEITGNVITGNIHSAGAGLSISSPGLVVVTGNLVQGNATFGLCASPGAGIFAAGRVRLVQNLVTGNSSPIAGGGLHLEVFSGAPMAVVNNTVVGNDAPIGTAVYVPNGLSTPCTLENNVFAGRGAPSAVFSPTLNVLLAAFRNNDVWNPGGAPYAGGMPDPTGTWGNFSADPLFANPLGGDFHLLPSSPCIDAGFAGAPFLSPTDADGDPRIYDGNADGSAVVDVGWDEYSPVASFGSACPGSGGFLPNAGVSGPTPAVGNGGFALTLSNALGGSAAFLLSGLAPLPAPVNLFFFGLPDCSLLVPPFLLAVSPVSGSGPGVGTVSLPLPIPNDPLLHGARVFFQWYVTDPGPALLPGAMSAGLDVTVL